jgi:hypothetical protein
MTALMEVRIFAFGDEKSFHFIIFLSPFAAKTFILKVFFYCDDKLRRTVFYDLIANGPVYFRHL